MTIPREMGKRLKSVENWDPLMNLEFGASLVPFLCKMYVYTPKWKKEGSVLLHIFTRHNKTQHQKKKKLLLSTTQLSDFHMTSCT